MKPASEVLNLGCGRKRIDLAVNVDINPEVGADLVYDLNHRPWPLPDNHFATVHAYDIIEHCSDFIGTMEEIHRTCRNEAAVYVTVPHFSSANAFTDPTHCHFFGYQSFSYVTGDHEFSFYTSRRFRHRVSQLVFQPTLFNKLLHRVANRWPTAYEKRWAWVFPAWFMYFELQVVKG